MHPCASLSPCVPTDGHRNRPAPPCPAGPASRARLRIDLLNVTLDPIFFPEKRKRGPKPAKVDLHTVFLTGTIVWIVVLVVMFLLRKLAGTHMVTLTLVTCGFGVIIGLCLLAWESLNRSTYTKLAGGTKEDGSFGIDEATATRESDGKSSGKAPEEASPDDRK